jgi:hypothetical protein
MKRQARVTVSRPAPSQHGQSLSIHHHPTNQPTNHSVSPPNQRLALPFPRGLTLRLSTTSIYRFPLSVSTDEAPAALLLSSNFPSNHHLPSSSLHDRPILDPRVLRWLAPLWV